MDLAPKMVERQMKKNRKSFRESVEIVLEGSQVDQASLFEGL